MTKIRSTETYRIPGIYEPIEYTVEHIVCDECGTSDIHYQRVHESRFVDGVLSVLLIAAIVFFYGAIVVGFITHRIELCWGTGMISVVALLIHYCLSSYGERDNYYQCNKCGNEHITR